MPLAELSDAGFDCVVHASGNPAGLASALRCLALEGRVIDVSWYGAKTVPLALGEDFHDRRLTIRSSQVAHVSPGHSREERSDEVLRVLREDGAALDALLGPEIELSELPATMRAIYEDASPFPMPTVRYPKR